MTTNMIRILLVDDHTLLRTGLRGLLQTLPGIEVVAEAGDGRQALKLSAEHRPDVVLMDISMKGMNGLEATAQLTRDCPQTKVIILSMHTGEEYLAQALRAGAAGYLLKEAELSEVELAIRAVMRGEVYLSAAVARWVVADYLRRFQDRAPEVELLSPRQREVAQLIAEGHSTREIAGMLHLSVKTVETHRRELMQALGVHDVAGVVRWAIKARLIDS